MPEDQFTEDQEQLFGDQLEEDPTAEDYSFEPGQAEEISMDEVFEHGPEELDGDLLSGPEPESGAAGEGTPMDGGTGAGGETRGFKFPEPNPVLQLPPIPTIPVRKRYSFKEPHSRPNRNQLMHHKRLCRKLGIPADVADQVALLFYGTKQLLSDRMDELNLIICFDEMMGVRPGSMTDILRILHYRVEAVRKRSQAGLQQFEEALREGKDVKAAVEAAKPPPAPRAIDIDAGEPATAGRHNIRFTEKTARVLKNIMAITRRTLCFRTRSGNAIPAAAPGATDAKDTGGTR